MNPEFKDLFSQLCNKPYQAHWWARLTSEKVLAGEPSDCSDRAYVLADWCKENNIPYSFILTLFTKPELSLHMALVVDGMVYDPIWKLCETPVQEYKQLLGGSMSGVFGSWIQKIIP